VPHLVSSDATLTDDAVIGATREWLERAVIGLNLCPFAKAVHSGDRVRYRVSQARDAEQLLRDLSDELQALHAADPAVCETTLLVHPWVLGEFLDYNDFLDVADAAVDALGLTEELQVASFHPHYQFADTQPGDIQNYSNRSPFPTLHLLRQASVDAAVAAFPDAAAIFEKSIATLERLGHDGWERVMAGDAEVKPR
jgi:hypothetical protein